MGSRNWEVGAQEGIGTLGLNLRVFIYNALTCKLCDLSRPSVPHKRKVDTRTCLKVFLGEYCSLNPTYASSKAWDVRAQPLQPHVALAEQDSDVNPRKAFSLLPLIFLFLPLFYLWLLGPSQLHYSLRSGLEVENSASSGPTQPGLLCWFCDLV